MSIRLLSQVWNHDVTGNTRSVLQVLCEYAGDDGICWPANESIAFKVGISKRQVQRILIELTRTGVIESLEVGGLGPRSTNKVRVNLDAIPLKKGDTCMSPLAVTDKGDKGDISTNKGDISEPKGDIHMSSEPSYLEPSFLEPTIVPPLPPKNLRQTKVQYTDDYKAFVRAYPANGRGSFPEGFKLWQKMTDDERADAMSAIPKFIAGRDFQEGFQPGPEVWLRARKWENPPVPHKAPLNGEHPNAARIGKWVG